ncbi:histone-lysine N-methyltransferase SETD1-like isoform X2 [Oratosquilla oratoria]|uniref:histone-lysine N-methyltransferase SETD1-like isoform X2 n=1 Tax=Oratosquilla oratoria TaxID=337810 RepID=UPI003F75A3E6
MDQSALSHHPPHRGNLPPPAPHGGPPPYQQKRNYKLLIDPVLVKGTNNKLYRFEGVVEGDPTYPPVVLRDPRKHKLWIRPETLDLTVPRFKIDSNYVGDPPPLEVTIFNINDNIDQTFLHNEIVNKHQCGMLESLHIFTHSLSRKHLGIARLVFEEPESSRRCVEKLNNATLMGKVLHVFLDPFGEECKSKVEEIRKQLEEEAKREEEAKEARKRPPPPPTKPPPPPPPPTNSEETHHHERHTTEKNDFERNSETFSQNRYETERKSSSLYQAAPQAPAVNSAPSGTYYNDRQYGYHANFQSYDQSYHHYQSYTRYQDYRPGYSNTTTGSHQWSGGSSHTNQPPSGQQWTASSSHTNPVVQEHSSDSQPSWESSKLRPDLAKNSHMKSPVHEPGVETWSGRVPEISDGREAKVKPKPESDNEDEKSTLDLDTRIAMLLQNKDCGIAPPFLNFGAGSDDDDDKKEDSDDKDMKKTSFKAVASSSSSSSSDSSDSSMDSDSSSGSSSLGDGTRNSRESDERKSDVLGTLLEPLSSPPSPFISHAQYLYWHERSIALKKEAIKKEKEETREKLKKLKKKKVKKKEKKKEAVNEKIEKVEKDETKPIIKQENEELVNGADDDRMSLSSLSSTEDPILHQDVPIPPNLPLGSTTFTAPPPGYPGYATQPSYPPPYLPPTYPHTQETNYHWQPPPGYPSNLLPGYPGYNPAYSTYPPGTTPAYASMMAPPPMPGAAVTPGQPPFPYYSPSFPPPAQAQDQTHKSGQYHDPTLNAVLDTVIEELKKILKKDFNKRMIESTAFKTFEAWWDEQERKFKSQAVSETNREKVPAPTISRPEGISSLSTLFESREGLGIDSMGLGSMGLGFRAAMPKMPSFRRIRKIRPPSPPQPDDDSRMSEEEATQQDRKRKQSSDESSDSDSGPEELMPAREKPVSPVGKGLSKWSSDESGGSSDKSEVDEPFKEEESESESESSDEESSDLSAHEEENEDNVDYRSLEEEFEKFLKDVIDTVMKTPERNRPPTPLPNDSVDSNDLWMDAGTTPTKTKVSATTPLITPKKTTKSPTSKAPKKPRAKPTPKKPGKAKVDKVSETVTKQVRPSQKPDEPSQPGSETDTADEKSDLEDGSGESTAAAEALIQLAGVAVNGTKSSSSSCSEDDQRSPVLMEHSYCLPWTPKESSQSSSAVSETVTEKGSKTAGEMDHDYTRPRTPPVAKMGVKTTPKKTPKPTGKENRIAHVHKDAEGDAFDKRRLGSKPVLASATTFKLRNQLDEYNVLYSFLIRGIDQEDIELLKRSYEKMLSDPNQSYWLNDTHWVGHPPTDIPLPPRKKRKVDDLPLHKTGCARTEGIYKVDSKQKQRHKFTSHQEIANTPDEQQQSLAVLESSKAKPTQMSVSREVRAFQRRLLTAFGNETDSDLLKFNQLKFRKKLLRFGKSRIHDWGLFAMEAIAADEMVIEYVGQMIRPIVADLRENNYEKMGIGSSYLFRIDMEAIIDATKCGNLARFINHSCNPNCYAKIISVEGQKKIVIYSKQPIACGDEITYDYKFPIEDEKIVCLCGASQCKGTLN